MYVCIVFPFILDDRLVDVPAGVTLEEGHTAFLIRLPSVVLALIFLVRRVQPIFSLVERVKSNFCVCVCFLPIHSGHQVRWTYQPGSHRRKVTQDFSSTFLRCVPKFFSREGFSHHSFPSSTVKSNFVYV